MLVARVANCLASVFIRFPPTNLLSWVAMGMSNPDDVGNIAVAKLLIREKDA
jgi:hypothetical protein